MTEWKISLPDALSAFVEAEIARQEYDDANDYFCALLRAEQKRQSKKQLTELLLDGLKQGDTVPLSSDLWAQLRQDAPAVEDDAPARHEHDEHSHEHQRGCGGKDHSAGK